MNQSLLQMDLLRVERKIKKYFTAEVLWLLENIILIIILGKYASIILINYHQDLFLENEMTKEFQHFALVIRKRRKKFLE